MTVKKLLDEAKLVTNTTTRRAIKELVKEKRLNRMGSGKKALPLGTGLPRANDARGTSIIPVRSSSRGILANLIGMKVWQENQGVPPQTPPAEHLRCASPGAGQSWCRHRGILATAYRVEVLAGNTPP